MNNVIIGAGQCGRGYIARLLTLSKESFTFIDKDEILIKELQEQKQYKISFCGSDRESLTIDKYEALSWNDLRSLEVIAQADLIFTSIGEQNLSSIILPITQALKQRTKKQKPILITAENGTAPKQELACLKTHVQLSESVIFCTTLNQASSLDILSEDLDYLPYDRLSLENVLCIYGMKEEEQFKQLLERKIYTYNSLSACISYLGAYLGYEDYGEAANDVLIRGILDHAKKELDAAISACYEISLKKQQKFSEMAIAKFMNCNIIDTIERNARDVKRKLGKKERILAPIHLITEHKGNTASFILTCAAALWYGEKTKTFNILDKDTKNEWENMCKNIVSHENRKRIEALYTHFHKGDTFLSIKNEVGL